MLSESKRPQALGPLKLRLLVLALFWSYDDDEVQTNGSLARRSEVQRWPLAGCVENSLRSRSERQSQFFTGSELYLRQNARLFISVFNLGR